MISKEQAGQIAELLNTRNELTKKYTAEEVIKAADNYLLELDKDVVIGCVEVKKMQWYQWEIRHLSVSKAHEGRGLGKRLIRRAEDQAKRDGARIVQCTIRVGNEASEGIFRGNGYHQTCCFFNASAERYVAVWQKVLSYRP